VLCWHMIIKGEDYAFARPSLTVQKLRKLELRAGMPSHRGRNGRPRRPSSSRAWPPPMGRAFQGPLRGKLRGRPQSQNLRFAPGSTTP
jgi:hypothetical protein